MPLSCECFEKLSLGCPWELDVIGYIAGWLGIIWRTVLVALISNSLSHITDQDPGLYSTFLACILAYFTCSFLTNCAFLYGIFKERRQYILPHLIVIALEMAFGIIISSGIVMIMFAVNSIGSAFFIFFIAALVIGVHFVLWLYNVLLYKDFGIQAISNRGRKNNIPLTSVHRYEI